MRRARSGLLLVAAIVLALTGVLAGNFAYSQVPPPPEIFLHHECTFTTCMGVSNPSNPACGGAACITSDLSSTFWKCTEKNNVNCIESAAAFGANTCPGTCAGAPGTICSYTLAHCK